MQGSTYLCTVYIASNEYTLYYSVYSLEAIYIPYKLFTVFVLK